MKLSFFFRKKLPHAFSIDGVFTPVIHELKRAYPEYSEVNRVEMNYDNFSFLDILRNIISSRKFEGDLNHITCDIYSILLGFRKPTIITIHDCNPLVRYSKWNYRYWIYRFLIYEIPIWLSKAVTVVSEKSRRELLSLTNCPDAKIRVIPNFVDPEYSFKPKTFNKAKPVILQIGTRENKNLVNLLEALNGIPCHLRIIGPISLNQQAKLDQLKIEYSNVVDISKKEIILEYRSCDLVAFISKYEGFGLPILEAQSTGRVIITSDLSPMNEIAGEGALKVDPNNITQIKKGIKLLIEDSVRRETLIQKGKENVKNYHLSKVTNQYHKLYQQVSFSKKQKVIFETTEYRISKNISSK